MSRLVTIFLVVAGGQDGTVDKETIVYVHMVRMPENISGYLLYNSVAVKGGCLSRYRAYSTGVCLSSIYIIDLDTLNHHRSL
jgi:hypothetical protein